MNALYTEKPKLRLSFTADDNWVGTLNARVDCKEFSGQGQAWFDRTELQKGFLLRLKDFPLEKDNPIRMRGGYWDKKNEGNLEQCHLQIIIQPYGARGSLLVCIDLADPYAASPDEQLQQAVTARFITSYPALGQFAAELEQVLQGTRDFALLMGDGP